MFDDLNKTERMLLDKLRRGVENAKLARELGDDTREIRYIVASLRKKDYPVCSGNAGYWIGKDDEDVNKSKARIMSSAHEHISIAEGLERSKANLHKFKDW